MALSLYFHVPYCEQKCLYCDFNSYAVTNGINKNFFDALKKEIFIKSEELGHRPIASIFFGGGTPTICPVEKILEILNYCFERFSIESDCEISIEANPNTVSYEYLKALKRNGFNRLSLGCQAFNNNILKKIGRLHNCRDIYRSIFAAQKAGFENISLDLMFGLPEQTCDIWEETLQNAIQLNPHHLSVYNLTIEKNTPFYNLHRKGELSLPPEDLQLKMYKTAIKNLSRNDYIHYEISNFALSGYECRHNKVYWNNMEYLGFGPGAASYLNGIRAMNIYSPDEYVLTLLSKNEIPVFEKEVLDSGKSMSETLVLGLRLLDGINIKRFEERFGKSLSLEFGEKIKKLQEEQLLEYDTNRLKLTDKGIFFSNEVFVELL